MKSGKTSEARDKFIEAFIAEPYRGLHETALLTGRIRITSCLLILKSTFPPAFHPLENGKMSINLDPSLFKGDDKNGASAAWMMYGLVRASWATTDFARAYPEEKVYRHSLKEEAGLPAHVVKVLADQKKDKNSKTQDRSLQNLAKLEEQGYWKLYTVGYSG